MSPLFSVGTIDVPSTGEWRKRKVTISSTTAKQPANISTHSMSETEKPLSPLSLSPFCAASACMPELCASVAF